MSVYVSNGIEMIKPNYWRCKHLCRLTADNELELHNFANMLGFLIRHSQRDYIHGPLYYWIDTTQRIFALEQGAIGLTDDEVKAVMRRLMGKPSISRPPAPQNITSTQNEHKQRHWDYKQIWKDNESELTKQYNRYKQQYESTTQNIR